ncbi:flavin reductase family protein [Sedimentitalea nanhaiensis]|uniref:NADH-FMN oxidoreductase RutF, flavin reductase (DIM6/NTAB) family n=1 Tax=Sedimentitalea nanhaiensis TaxID=999627 RepID=A0A1I7DYY4_9RHOB|nr:flavin reductase family protein [Sedimentitalea nanhaiensis]SFU16845.1 NADH-FMN oxidoreductase RutF, flavin reductase (DIM6/NTAB) family [Sedimentitalea nanhaiensis]
MDSPNAQSDRFDFASLSARDRYKLLIGSVVPRPIAWVTTIDEKGTPNAAPFSFFNCLSSDPAILALGVENHADMRFKDTGRNIRVTEEFTVNIVGFDNLEAMNVTAVPFAAGIDEIEAAGMSTVPGEFVACPQIAEAPIRFECRKHVTLNIGKSREIVLGEVLAMHARPGLVNDRFHVDAAALDALGRMGGHGYCRSNKTFDLPTMSETEWRTRATGTN